MGPKANPKYPDPSTVSFIRWCSPGDLCSEDIRRYLVIRHTCAKTYRAYCTADTALAACASVAYPLGDYIVGSRVGLAVSIYWVAWLLSRIAPRIRNLMELGISSPRRNAYLLYASCVRTRAVGVRRTPATPIHHACHDAFRVTPTITYGEPQRYSQFLKFPYEMTHRIVR